MNNQKGCYNCVYSEKVKQPDSYQINHNHIYKCLKSKIDMYCNPTYSCRKHHHIQKFKDWRKEVNKILNKHEYGYNKDYFAYYLIQNTCIIQNYFIDTLKPFDNVSITYGIKTKFCRYTWKEIYIKLMSVDIERTIK